MMLLGEIKENFSYISGLSIRKVMKIAPIHGTIEVMYAAISGAKHDGHHVHTLDGLDIYIVPLEKFGLWADSRVGVDSIEAVVVASVTAVPIRDGLAIDLGTVYWSGGDCLRKVVGLTWHEGSNRVVVRFRHLLGEDGRVCEESDDLGNNIFYLGADEFLKNLTVVATFGRESLLGWLASENVYDCRERIPKHIWL